MSLGDPTRPRRRGVRSSCANGLLYRTPAPLERQFSSIRPAAAVDPGDGSSYQDEHPWIESFGCTAAYRDLRRRIRRYYRANYALTAAAREREHLNPGNGAVSKLCHEPKAALAALESILAPYASSGRLVILREHEIVGANVEGAVVRGLSARDLRNGREVLLEAPYALDATEPGDLLPLCGAEHVLGAESRDETGEPHAAEEADPSNQQAFTACFAMDYLPGEDHTLDKPTSWQFWRDFVPELTPPWPGRLLAFTYSHPVTLEPRDLPLRAPPPRSGAQRSVPRAAALIGLLRSPRMANGKESHGVIELVVRASQRDS